MSLALIALLDAAPGVGAASFAEEQKRFPRVREAFAAKEETLKALFARRKAPFPPARIFLRAFKAEKLLELWAAGAGGPLLKVKDYPICRFSGEPGPKRRLGDNQVPEGFYHVDRFNPRSSFHLSLGLNYPNASDRVLGERGNLGGDIFIHGDCVSIGCLAMTDDLIKELYVAALLARSAGQRRIPVHVFPGRLDALGLKGLLREKPDHAAFWSNLKEGYDLFEKSRVPPEPRVNAQGRYLF